MKHEKTDPVAFSIVFQLIVGSIIGLFALFKGFVVHPITSHWVNFMLMIVLYGIGNICVFNALKRIEASEATVLFSTTALWSAAAAVLFLHEQFSIQQTFGMFLILLSVYLVSWRPHKARLSSGEIYGLLAAAAFGISFINDAFIVKSADVPSYLTIAFIAPALGIWLVKPSATKYMKHLFEKKIIFKLLLLGVLYAIASISIFLAYQLGNNAAQIGSLTKISTIITVIFAIIFLGERDFLLRKFLGALVSIIGVILLT